jgi:hypothetical protein
LHELGDDAVGFVPHRSTTPPIDATSRVGAAMMTS